MNKTTTVVIAIFVLILVVFLTWNKFYGLKSGSCYDSTDCAPRQPKSGFYYTCEEGICVEHMLDETKQCLIDQDCVPAGCCHASEAVNKDNAPDCADVFCTTECQEGTLDCGQGEVKCISGSCEVVLKN